MYLGVPVSVRVIKNIGLEVDPREFSDDHTKVVEELRQLVRETTFGEVDEYDLEAAALAVISAKRSAAV